MEDIHFFGIDESANQVNYINRNGRPFTIVLCHSKDESETLPSKLEKKRFFDLPIFNSEFIYLTRTSNITSRDYIKILINIIKEGLSRYCKPDSTIYGYLDPLPRAEEKFMDNVKKEIYSSINRKNFFLCFDNDTRNPLVNKADHLAGIISYYKSTNIKHKERQKSFRYLLPNLDNILAKHDLNI